MSDRIKAARDVPVEVIEAGLSTVDWDAIRAGEADPEEAAAHAIRYAAVALRARIAEELRTEGKKWDFIPRDQHIFNQAAKHVEVMGKIQ